MYSQLSCVNPLQCSVNLPFTRLYHLCTLLLALNTPWSTHTHVHAHAHARTHTHTRAHTHTHTRACTPHTFCTLTHCIINLRLTVLIVSQENTSTLRAWKVLLELSKVFLTIPKEAFRSGSEAKRADFTEQCTCAHQCTYVRTCRHIQTHTHPTHARVHA